MTIDRRQFFSFLAALAAGRPLLAGKGLLPPAEAAVSATAHRSSSVVGVQIPFTVEVSEKGTNDWKTIRNIIEMRLDSYTDRIDVTPIFEPRLYPQYIEGSRVVIGELCFFFKDTDLAIARDSEDMKTDICLGNFDLFKTYTIRICVEGDSLECDTYVKGVSHTYDPECRRTYVLVDLEGTGEVFIT